MRALPAAAAVVTVAAALSAPFATAVLLATITAPAVAEQTRLDLCTTSTSSSDASPPVEPPAAAAAAAGTASGGTAADGGRGGWTRVRPARARHGPADVADGARRTDPVPHPAPVRGGRGPVPRSRGPCSPGSG